MTQACIECSAVVIHPALTGVFCDDCFEREQQSPDSFLRSSVTLGVFALATPFALTLSYNGLHYVKLICGVIAMLAAAKTFHKALGATDDTRAKVFGVALLLAAGAVFHVWSGVFG